MTDNDQALDIERVRQRFSGRIRGDLSNLYRVYCRVHEMAEAAGDDELRKAADQLLHVWDDIANTAAVKVIANGSVEWVKTGCGPTPEEALAGIDRLMGDEALRSNLLDEEWKATLEAGRQRLEAGGLYADVHRTIAAVNEAMGNPNIGRVLAREDVFSAMLAVLNEAWHDAA